jgi:hypothetical protein
MIDMKKFVTQQQQLFVTKTENEFVKQVRRRINFRLELLTCCVGI